MRGALSVRDTALISKKISHSRHWLFRVVGSMDIQCLIYIPNFSLYNVISLETGCSPVKPLKGEYLILQITRYRRDSHDTFTFAKTSTACMYVYESHVNRLKPFPVCPWNSSGRREPEKSIIIFFLTRVFRLFVHRIWIWNLLILNTVYYYNLKSEYDVHTCITLWESLGHGIAEIYGDSFTLLT